jgi:hypothetical protein
VSIQKAIFGVGVMIAVSVGSAIMLTNHYEVQQPFNPALFSRFNRWTGSAELCSSRYDDRTYCGQALVQRSQKAVDDSYAAAHQKFLDYGYNQEEIESWPANVLDAARNIVGNGGNKDEVVKMIDEWKRRNTPTK